MNGADRPAAGPADGPAGGVLGQVVLLADLGQHLVDDEAGVLVAERVVLDAAVVRVAGADRLGVLVAPWPGVMKMPMVTGISFLWIRLSRTCGTRSTPLGLIARWPSWKTSTQAGLSVYCAGT